MSHAVALFGICVRFFFELQHMGDDNNAKCVPYLKVAEVCSSMLRFALLVLKEYKKVFYHLAICLSLSIILVAFAE